MENRIQPQTPADVNLGINWTLEPTDIEWTFGLTIGKPPEQVFESDKALAHLIINDVVFINAPHWYEDAPEKLRHLTIAIVNCNDVFAWGCADGEELPYHEIETLYRMWQKDPEWGPSVWCMMQRKQMPQKPVEDRIRTQGIWNLDGLGLGSNTMDAEVAAALHRDGAPVQAAFREYTFGDKLKREPAAGVPVSDGRGSPEPAATVPAAGAEPGRT